MNKKTAISIYSACFLILVLMMTNHASSATWAKMKSGTTFNLNGVWGSSENDVFAVGDNGTILHYNGSIWSKMDSGTVTDFISVWGSSSNDVFITGDSGTIFHYNGMSWSQLDSPTNYTFYDIWGSSATDIFFVGPGIYHYDGTGWLNMFDPYWGFDRIWGSSGTDVFAVTGSSTIYHYDGTIWSELNSGSDSGFYALWGSSNTNVYFFTHSNYIVHYDGIDWDLINLNDYYYFSDCWGNSSNNIFAITWSGEIINYSGTSWREVYHDQNYTDLNAIWGSSAMDVFVIGDNGLILHYGGQTTTTTTFISTTSSSTISAGTTSTIPNSTTTTSAGTTSTIPNSTTTTIHGGITTTTVPEVPLKADFVANQTYGQIPLMVNFTNLSTGNIYNYQWDFGDTGTSTERNPSHLYTLEGTFTVSLRVSGNGKSDDEVKTGYITVKMSMPTTTVANTTTTITPLCPFVNYLEKSQDINTIRMLRNSLLKSPSGKILISFYYRNLPEISSILSRDQDLRNLFINLIQNKICFAEKLVAGQKIMISKNEINEVIEFLNKIKKQGSKKFGSEIDFTIMCIGNNDILKTTGVHVIE